MNTKILINKRFLLGIKIGSGSFGDIFLGSDNSKDITDSDKLVAIKLEKQKNPEPQYKILKFESDIYNYLNMSKITGIPKIYWHGYEGDYYVLVMQALGADLEKLLKKSKFVQYNLNKKKVNCFSIKTCCLIAQDIIKTIMQIHKLGFIHRDIKPENFLIGLNNNQIHLIDFGLCKLYVDKNHNHIKYKENNKLIGTIRYCSINSHNGLELSRRDDLESIGYVLIYLAKGYLPWQSLIFSQKVCEDIKEKKEKITSDELCKDLPVEFKLYIDYVKKLGFDETPNYNYLYSLFSKLYTNSGFLYDGIYDWN